MGLPAHQYAVGTHHRYALGNAFHRQGTHPRFARPVRTLLRVAGANLGGRSVIKSYGCQTLVSTAASTVSQCFSLAERRFAKTNPMNEIGFVKTNPMNEAKISRIEVKWPVCGNTP